MSRSYWRCWRPLSRSPSPPAPGARSKTGHEPRARSVDRSGRLRRCILLSGRDRRAAAVSGPAQPAARPDQSGQSWARLGGSRPAAPGRRAACWVETRRRLARRSPGWSHRHPTDCADCAAEREARVTAALAFDIGLALLVLGVGAWTVAARDTFAAVVGFVAYGLLLALVWVRLAALDVALTEAALGSGLTGGLLVGASTRLRRAETRAVDERQPASLRLAAAVLCTLVSAGVAAIVLLLPEPAPTLAPQAMVNMAATGLGNPVTAVLMAYRAIDTLLETVVLLLAL